ncbi:MAG TPA: hypothetical protein DF613_01150 [Lachnospiraceae bacterium]|nr:hypothetical protein [Lachnospiraceae bacterium]
MKKIGILTFHYVDNYGAVLQAYALRKILNGFDGYKAEIINYVPEEYEYRTYLEDDLIELFLERRKKFKTFIGEKCAVTSPMIHTLKGVSYDYYCVGSDQVWNLSLPEAKSGVYFLGGLDSKAIKFSYAASIGMDLDKINKDLFRQYISQFSHVGIREQSHIKGLSDCCHVGCVHNIDPTLLLVREDYEALIDSYGEELPGDGEPYVLYVWYGDDSLQSIECVNTVARKYELTVLHNFSSTRIITRKMLCRDGGYIFNKGIEEFLWYVKHAAFVVTNSYHVGIFSIIFERPVYFYAIEGKVRQEDLTEILGIENRMIRGYIKPDDINENIDFESVHGVIKELRERSLSYLRDVLQA